MKKRSSLQAHLTNKVGQMMIIKTYPLGTHSETAATIAMHDGRCVAIVHHGGPNKSGYFTISLANGREVWVVQQA